MTAFLGFTKCNPFCNPLFYALRIFEEEGGTILIKPDYYNSKGMDVIEYARNMFGNDAAKAFCRINILKYVTRYDKKNGVEDLWKAITYLNRLIEIETDETILK